MFDKIMWLLDILLLVIICIQGELIRRYEKWTWEMHKDRYEERKKWRLDKQKQTLKKSEQKTSDSSAPSELT